MSSLVEIEACPRRWALNAADYPELWGRRGYPPRLFIASLAGSVVHLALQIATRAFARAGCNSLEDAHAVQVMRELGGYTKVINDCVQRVLHRSADNPRAAPLLEVALRSLRSRVPEMRTEVQTHLGRVKLHGAPSTWSAEHSGKDRGRAPLGPGMHPELELRAPRIGWRGTVDLLELSSAACEIVDFKTGAQHDAHRFQLRVYALLWSRDSELNPTSREVGRLALSYRGAEVLVDPPTAVELDALEDEIARRSQAATKALGANPPQARPSAENCRYCAVRHLCGEYWQPTTARALAAEAPDDMPFMDLEILLTGRHGPSSWDGVVELSPRVDPGRQIVLRTPSPESWFEDGDRIRVLDAHVSTATDDEAQPAVATMTAMSEIFLVPRAKG